MRDFGCLKDKNREKDMGKGRGECEGQQDFFRGWRGGIFGTFLVRFFGFWKRRRIIYNLPSG